MYGIRVCFKAAHANYVHITSESLTNYFAMKLLSWIKLSNIY